MTKEQAIEVLTWYKKSWQNIASVPKYGSSHLIDAVEMAIEALEEKQEPEIVPIGTKIVVSAKIYNHYFQIGSEAIIVEYDIEEQKQPYYCKNAHGEKQYLSRDEFEIVEQ